MSERPVRPRRMRYRLGDEPARPLVSETLPRRVLYGGLFFCLAYCAHLYAFVRSEVEPVSEPPVLQASVAGVAPVDSGVVEPLLVRLVQGAGEPAMVTSASLERRGS